MLVSNGSSHLSFSRLIATAALWLAGMFSGAAHAASALTVPTELGSGVTIEIEKPLSQAPPTGLYPLLVKIHNGSSAAGEWVVGTGNAYGGRGGVTTQTSIGVGPGKSSAVWPIRIGRMVHRDDDLLILVLAHHILERKAKACLISNGTSVVDFGFLV